MSQSSQARNDQRDRQDPALLAYHRIFLGNEDAPDLYAIDGWEKHSWRDLHESRKGLFRACRELLDKASAEKRVLTADEKQANDVASDAIRAINLEMRHREENDPNGALMRNLNAGDSSRGGAGRIIRDKAGVEHRLLAPGDRLAPAQHDPRSHVEEIGLTALVRAHVFGARNDAEKRALAESPATAGGFAVPTIVAQQIIDLLRPQNALTRAGANLVTLEAQRTIFAAWATDPTMNWVPENGFTLTPDDAASIGMVAFDTRTLMGIVRMSKNLLEDAPNVELACERAIAAKAANEIDRVSLIGGGHLNAEPLGLVNTAGLPTIAPAGGNGASPSDYALILTALQTMQNANARPPTGLILNPHVNFELNGLQDTLHQPLRRPLAIEQLPFFVTSQLPQTETEGSSNVASSAYLGDFTDFWIGMRQELQVKLLEELYSESNQIGLLFRLRVDVAPMRLASFCRIKGLL